MVLVPLSVSTYTATITGKGWKGCRCEACGQEFVYHVTRVGQSTGLAPYGIGAESAREGAARAAHKRAAAALAHAVNAVACPACGWFQQSMVSAKRFKHVAWALGVTIPISLAILALSTNWPAGGSRLPFIAASVLVVAIGLSIVVWSLFVFDLNRGHPGKGKTHPGVARKSMAIRREVFDGSEKR